mmetsp:Transcript_64459/g.182885  ORF Transcript_64459/g.182885 Transcript_64459/m.182885 type:complete len:226 (+) Transcript_64459:121-798(+)
MRCSLNALYGGVPGCTRTQHGEEEEGKAEARRSAVCGKWKKAPAPPKANSFSCVRAGLRFAVPTSRLHRREGLVRVREGYFLPVFVEDQRHPLGVVLQLIHHRAVPQAPHVLLQTLHPGWRDLNHLLRVEARQAFPDVHAVELRHEPLARRLVPKVDETVADVALVFEIDGQVHEIKLPAKADAQLLDEHLSCVLVGNIPQHDCRVLLFLLAVVPRTRLDLRRLL